jgi:hypothetical protein
VQKIKDARSEAAKEIEAYKAKKEAEYKKYESEVSITSGPCLVFQAYRVCESGDMSVAMGPRMGGVKITGGDENVCRARFCQGRCGRCLLLWFHALPFPSSVVTLHRDVHPPR